MVKCDPSNLFNVVVFFYIHNGKSMKSGWFFLCCLDPAMAHGRLWGGDIG